MSEHELRRGAAERRVMWAARCSHLPGRRSPLPSDSLDSWAFFWIHAAGVRTGTINRWFAEG
jgi:hypothetical protein